MKEKFLKNLKSMLRVDFKRMFKSQALYIMAGICFIIPILILVMTSTMGGSTTVDPHTGIKTMQGFTNVWQIIGSVSGNMEMDMTSMCNINLIYFLVSIFVCMFVSDDFKSGYSKNLFTIRPKKTDYIISKTLSTFLGAGIMIASFFVGSLIGGGIAGLPFDLAGFGIGGLICCMLSKIFILLIFVSISLVLSVVAKQKLWLSILCSFAGGALLFTMISIMAPLNAGILNVIMCFVGGSMFAIGLGYVGNLILNKFDLV